MSFWKKRTEMDRDDDINTSDIKSFAQDDQDERRHGYAGSVRDIENRHRTMSKEAFEKWRKNKERGLKIQQEKKERELDERYVP